MRPYLLWDIATKSDTEVLVETVDSLHRYAPTIVALMTKVNRGNISNDPLSVEILSAGLPIAEAIVKAALKHKMSVMEVLELYYT